MNEPTWFLVRGKSERRRIRDRKEQLIKENLRLEKKKKKLYKAKYNLGYIQLDKPFQRGYERSFVLRRNLQNHPEADFYISLLQYINTTEYSSDDNFKPSKKNRRIKKNGIYKEQKLNHMTHKEFLKLNSKQQAEFFCIQTVSRYGNYIHRKYELVKKWRFELTIKPRIITKVKLFNMELEQKIGEVETHITRNNKIPMMMKARSKSTNHKWNWKKYITVREISFSQAYPITHFKWMYQINAFFKHVKLEINE